MLVSKVLVKIYEMICEFQRNLWLEVMVLERNFLFDFIVQLIDCSKQLFFCLFIYVFGIWVNGYAIWLYFAIILSL